MYLAHLGCQMQFSLLLIAAVPCCLSRHVAGMWSAERGQDLMSAQVWCSCLLWTHFWYKPVIPGFLFCKQGQWFSNPPLIGAWVLSHFICVQLFVTPRTVAHQAPLSMGFSRQECWSGLPCPSPGALPDPGIESTSTASPALAGRFFITEAPGKPGQISYLPVNEWSRIIKQ